MDQQPMQAFDRYGGYPMKWYKFQIYFSLFLGALSNFFQGIGYLSGNVYAAQGVDAQRFYAVFPGMKGVDMLFGLILLGLAALALVTRWRLAGLKAGAPKLLMWNYGAACAASLIYVALSAMASGLSIGALQNVDGMLGNIIASGLMIGLNSVYFKKRSNLFSF